jgi:hypothetical protein
MLLTLSPHTAHHWSIGDSFQLDDGIIRNYVVKAIHPPDKLEVELRPRNDSNRQKGRTDDAAVLRVL